tara:strand:- start:1394 stop:1834 length:441 start_codon:yes stop_codon:yes gene_type:complete
MPRTLAAPRGADLLARAAAPTSFYDFEKFWRSLAATEEPAAFRFEYMQTYVKPATLKQILRHTLEPDMLSSFVALFASTYCARKPKRTLLLLRAIASAGGFATALAMFSAEDDAALAQTFEALRSVAGIDAAKLDKAAKLYKVKMS